MDNVNKTVFETIVSPVLALLKEEADKLKNDALKYKLSFYFFSINLIYAAIKSIKSIALLVVDIKTSPDAKQIGLVDASRSMYSEAFSRYDPVIFRRIFYRLLEKLDFLEIPEIRELGRLLCVDGSVFSMAKNIDWAHYKTQANAIKIHLAYELNRMIPVLFICTDANSSEKRALSAMIEAGVTYIADRGYIGFSLMNNIVANNAFFVIRIKADMKYSVQEILDFNIPEQWQTYLSDVVDCKIQFLNDDNKRTYRLIMFSAIGETYFIATNRFDLKTHEVIMLYAYRWQIELFFRTIKRTFNALHLWSHDRKGVEVHFYIYLIAYILLLSFKQNCEKQVGSVDKPDSIAIDDSIEKPDSTPNHTTAKKPDTPNNKRESRSRIPPACGMVTLLGNRLKQFWKISIHWLTALNNLLFQPLTLDTFRLLIT